MTIGKEGGSDDRRALVDRLLEKRGIRPQGLAEIAHAPRDQPAQLSFTQQAQWFLAQLEPRNATYNVPLAVELTGALDRDALAAALVEMIRRHAILRTTFVEKAGRPLQRVGDPPTELLVHVCLQQAADPEGTARRITREEAKRPFDLLREIPVRGMLIELGPGRHWLLLTFHHSAIDGWSVGIIYREMTALYTASANGRAYSLAEPSIQYLDYAEWQHAPAQRERLEKQLGYWARQLADPPVLDLPVDRPRPASPARRGAKHGFKLPAALVERLERLGQEQGCTLFMVLLAALDALLHRYTGQLDLVIGTPIANRTPSVTEQLIGHFANTLALRLNLGGNPSFNDLLQRVRQVALDAYVHQDVPFDVVVETVRPARELGASPLFSVMFVLQNAPRATLTLPGVKVEPLALDTETAKFDLLFSMWPAVEGLHAFVEYDADLYEPETIAGLVRHYVVLVETVAGAPQTRLDRLVTGSALERATVSISAPRDRFDLRLAAQAREHPDLPAVRFGAETLSYATLVARVDEQARVLRAAGVEPGDPVGVTGAPSITSLVSALAVVQMDGILAIGARGGAPPDDWLAWRVERGVPVRGRGARGDGGAGLALWLRTAHVQPPPLEHARLLQRVDWLQSAFGLAPGDRVLHLRRLDDSLIVEVLWPLVAGAEIVVPSPDRDLASEVAAAGISVLYLPPSELPALPRERSLRHVLVSGGPLSGAVAQEFTTALPDVRVSFLQPAPDGAVEIARHEVHADEPVLVPAGRPTARSLRIEDRRGNLVPQGAFGAIHIDGIDTGLCGRLNSAQDIELQLERCRIVWVDGTRVDVEVLAEELTRHAAIAGAAVVPRVDRAGRLHLLAYVVPAGPRFEPPVVDVATPVWFVPVSTLPYTPEGDLDIRTLARLPVIEDGLMRDFEARVRADSGVRGAAVFMGHVSPLPRALHVRDLLPTASPAAAPAVVPSHGRDVPDRPAAYATGGQLVVRRGEPQTMTEALLRSAERADSGLIHVLEGGETIRQSYADLVGEARRVLGGLIESGCRAGDNVVLQIEDTRAFFSAFWGCVLGGIAPLTVAVPPSYTVENPILGKVRHAWSHLGRPVIVASHSLAEGMRGSPHFQGARVLGIRELRAAAPCGLLHTARPEEHLFIQLTSGSTGAPKCIPERHGAVVAHVVASRDFNGYGPSDVCLNWLPTDHVVPILTCHLRDVFLGARELQASTTYVLGDIGRWLDLIEAHRVTHTWAPNFAFRLVADRLETGNRTWDLSSLKRAMNAGEQVTLPVAAAFLRAVGPFGVSEQVMQPAFGMAETGTCVTYQNSFSIAAGGQSYLTSSLGGPMVRCATGAPGSTNFVDLGPPIPGVEIRIVASEGGPLQEETIGRVQFRGPVVHHGYIDNDEANREAFVGDGWFDSGDLGVLRDGRLSITGRAKERLVVRGANFYCHEIEDVANAVPGVEPGHVAACAAYDPDTGEDGFAVFFVPRPGERTETLALRIRTKIAAEMGVSPLHVLPLAQGAFPKTTSGKIQRASLAAELRAGAFAEAIKTADLDQRNDNTLPDWFFQSHWMRQRRGACRRRADGLTVLFGADVAGPIDGRVIRVQPGQEYRRHAADSFTIRPERAEDYDRLFEDLPRAIGAVVHAWTCVDLPEDPGSLSELQVMRRLGIDSLVLLAQALDRCRVERRVRVLVVSRGAQAILARDVLAPGRASLPALVRCLAKELEWFDGCHVDIDGERAAWSDVVDELPAVGGALEVAFRGGERWVSRLARVRLASPENACALRRGGRYLVTGGLGGVGALVARALLRDYDARLVIVGRRQERALGSEDLRVLRSLRRLGSVRYAAADVCDLTALKEAAAGDLDGILHLAGEYRECVIRDESVDGMDVVLRSKVLGTWTLAQLLDRRDAVFICFGSVNGFLGGYGMSAYATGNRFLDAFVRHLRARGQRAYCLSYSLWDDIGMSRHTASVAVSRQSGYAAIQGDLGILSLRVSLHHDLSSVLIGLDGGHPQVSRQLVEAPRAATVLRAVAEGEWSGGAITLEDPFGTSVVTDVEVAAVLPRDGHGNIDHAVLSSRGAPDPRVQAPRTELEHELARIWKELLGLTAVGRDDNFFELGGHSLLAVALISRIRDRLSVEVPVRALFATPTIAGLARTVGEAHSPATSERIPIIARRERLPLAVAQETYFRLEERLPHTHLFNTHTAVHVRGPLDAALFEASLAHVVARHEVLRTGFQVVDGVVTQVVHPTLEVDVPIIDVSALPAVQRQQAVDRLVRLASRAPFDVGRPPLFRASLLALGPDEHVVVITLHHIVSDGRSLGLFVRELLQGYEAAAEGRAPAALSCLPIQYADYAAWERARLASTALDEQRRFWRRQLEGLGAAPLLPTDRPRPIAAGLRPTHAQELVVPSDRIAPFEHLARETGSTLFMVTLGLIKLTIRRLTKADDVIVGSLVTLRNRSEIENLIGLFANTVLLRTRLPDDLSARDALARVRDTMVGAFANRELPFDEVLSAADSGSVAQDPFRVLVVGMGRSGLPMRCGALDVAPLRSSGEVRVGGAPSSIDLIFSISERDDGALVVGVTYADLFEDTTIRQLLAALERLAHDIAEAPDRPIARLFHAANAPGRGVSEL